MQETENYLKMEASNYELLIRTAYECDQDELIGSNAQSYRLFEKTITQLTDSACDKTEEERVHEYFSAFFLIKYFVGHALLEGSKKIKNIASVTEIDILKALHRELTDDAFLDKSRLDGAIVEAANILQRNGLQVG